MPATRLTRTCPLVLAASLLIGCSEGHSVARSRAGRTNPTVVPWPAADAIFHQDPRWQGSDGAYSVDLGRGRVLWLFGDTGVTTATGSAMARNTVGLMTGLDPVTATMTFHWRTARDGRPASFFPEQGKFWYWPEDGARLGAHGPLLVFLARIRRERTGPPGWDFKDAGWKAVLIPNPDDDPSRWRLDRVRLPANRWNITVGSAGAMIRQGRLYTFGERNLGEGANHDEYLVRWPLTSAAAGDLSAPEWWAGKGRGFVPQAALAQAPPPLFFDSALTESVYPTAQGRFVTTETVGFGGAALGVRNAPGLTGPWSDVSQIWRPPESDRKDTLVYGFKAHPELSAAGALAVTYVASSTSTDPVVLFGTESNNYPRFVRLRVAH